MLTSVNRNRKSCELWRMLFTRRKNQCPLDFLNIIEILRENDKERGRYANYIFAEFYSAKQILPSKKDLFDTRKRNIRHIFILLYL